jgi:uncharacterized peroxidase-related enzyme
MAHIPTQHGLYGITSLLEYRLDTSEPIRELTQVLLRGPSPLSEFERELIATVVSHENNTQFCSAAHATVARRLAPSPSLVDELLAAPTTTAPTTRLECLVAIARAIQLSPQGLTDELVQAARSLGFTDLELHDAVLTAALFCFYNRYVDGLASDLPPTDRYYDVLADRLTTTGYVRVG